MKTVCFSSVVAIATVLLMGCTKDNDLQTTGCEPPATLAAQAPCESGYPGVLLIASDYKEANGPMQFIYYIYPQKDTLSSDVTKVTYANASNERIIINEAVLNNAPKFAVRVTVNCNGKDIESKYFSFIKRPATRQGCYVWGKQSI